MENAQAVFQVSERRVCRAMEQPRSTQRYHHLRSDNSPEFIANPLRQWLARLAVKTLFIEPDSPWENGYVESFNGKMRDELPDREIFFTLEEAKTLSARWREEYNHIRPHRALGYRPPAPQTWLLAAQLVRAPSLT